MEYHLWIKGNRSSNFEKTWRTGLRMQLSWLRACLASMKFWVPSSTSHKQGVLWNTYNPNTWEIETRRSEVHHMVWLHSEMEISVWCMKNCIEKLVTEEIQRHITKWISSVCTTPTSWQSQKDKAINTIRGKIRICLGFEGKEGWMNRGLFLGWGNYFLQWICVCVNLLNPQKVQHQEWILTSTLTMMCHRSTCHEVEYWVWWRLCIYESKGSTFLLHFGVDIKLL